MNYLNSKTFCASAWFSVRNDNTEQLSPCCAIDCTKTAFTNKSVYTLSETTNAWHNSEYMQHLRKELATGVFPPECSSCKNNEENNLKSIRTSSNKSIANNQLGIDFKESWLKLYFMNKVNYKSDLLVSIDAMISNFCNYECVMCNPLDSSKIKSNWSKNKDHTAIQPILKQNPLYLDNSTQLIKNINAIDHFHAIIKKHPITFLHIRGGEPFIDKHLMDLIKQLPDNKKKKIRLLFNTNASVDLTNHIKQLNGFKDIIIIASLDAIGSYAEYVRKNCVWKETESFIDDAMATTPAIIKVHCTVHALNIVWLHQLEHWCKDRNLEMSFEFVSNPDVLTLEAVPPDVLEYASQLIQNQGIKARIKKVVFDRNLHKQLLEYIDFYDLTSTTTFNKLLNKKGDIIPSFKIN